LKDPAQLDSLLVLNITLSDTYGMDALLAEPIDVIFESRRRVLSEQALKDAQVTLVVDLGAVLEGCERLDHLHSEPVALILYFAKDHLFKELQAALFEDSQLAAITLLELITEILGELQLRLLFLVQAPIVLLVSARLPLRLLRSLGRRMVT